MKDGSNVLTVTSAGDSKDSALISLEKILPKYKEEAMEISEDSLLDLFSLLVEPGTCGTREEWLYHFERTKATNAPGMLFADAVKHQLLLEGEPSLLIFVGRSEYE